jgi:3-methyl-2-oxobutanoate hydroxymethyltransferase
MKSILDFHAMKLESRKISMLTCYDFWSAQILEKSQVDCLLVGDSLAMVVHGFPTTVHATIEMMTAHTAAVVRGAPSKFVVADMPFLSFRKGVGPALDAAGALMRAGAHAVKLEGVDGHEDVVRALVESGIPVMGHLGLTPQSVHQLGGFRVQGKDEEQALKLIAQAKQLQTLGCFSLVLECVPRQLAEAITKDLTIATIGIGAGAGCDGQVLVLPDFLGANPDFTPRFLKRYANLHTIVREAADRYDAEVKATEFPTTKESYT